MVKRIMFNHMIILLILMSCPISKANLTPKDDGAHTASGVFFWYLDAVLNLFKL